MKKATQSEVDGTPASPEPGPAVEEASGDALDPEQVAKLAYSYAEARGFQGGSPDQDWFRAEEEIRHSRTKGSE